MIIYNMLVEGQDGTVIPFNGVKVSVDGVFGCLSFLVGDKWLLLGKYVSIERAEAIKMELVRNIADGERQIYILPME